MTICTVTVFADGAEEPTAEELAGGAARDGEVAQRNEALESALSELRAMQLEIEELKARGSAAAKRGHGDVHSATSPRKKSTRRRFTQFT